MGAGLYLCLVAVVGVNILINLWLLKANGLKRGKSRLWSWTSFGGFGLAVLWLIAGASFRGLPGWPVILFFGVSFLSDCLWGSLMVKNAKNTSA